MGRQGVKGIVYDFKHDDQDKQRLEEEGELTTGIAGED